MGCMACFLALLLSFWCHSAKSIRSLNVCAGLRECVILICHRCMYHGPRITTALCDELEQRMLALKTMHS